MPTVTKNFAQLDNAYRFYDSLVECRVPAKKPRSVWSRHGNIIGYYVRYKVETPEQRSLNAVVALAKRQAKLEK